MILAALALAACLAAPAAACDPACAPGQDCARVETCNDLRCTESFRCEGTPDDCRTNGCQVDHQACRFQSENVYACEEKSCEPLPWSYDERPYDWRCVEWSEGGCCLDWRLVDAQEVQ